jgi:hypothetical protein
MDHYHAPVTKYMSSMDFDGHMKNVVQHEHMGSHVFDWIFNDRDNRVLSTRQISILVGYYCPLAASELGEA